jgi:glutamine amidotransferase
MTTPAAPHVAIVDACSGNLRSVARALDAAGARPVITRDPAVVRRADRVVFPGQGAFAEGIRGLVAAGLDDALRDVLAAARPVLGICLGLQIFFDESAEHGPVAGLGVLGGRVARLAPRDPAAKVPHIGWNTIERPAGAAAEPLLTGIADGTAFYFVHSYAAVPRDPGIIAATTDHGGPVVAAVRHGSLFATQFHPEKSQAAGLSLLRNFLRH